MLRLIGRKLALIALLLPLLHWAGFQYAIVHPRYSPYLGASIMTLRQNANAQLPRYTEYLQQLWQGQFGEYRGLPLTELLREPLAKSLVLVGIALLASALIGPWLGIASVSSRTMRIKAWALVLYTTGLSMPGFLLGVLAIGAMIYAVIYRGSSGTILPLSGFGLGKHLILPILVLASRPTLQIARLTANLVENELQQEYIRVARSKGLAWISVFWRHAFPNVASAIVLAIGQSSRLLISGLIIVETLFLWPGIGRIFMYDIGIRTDGRADFGFFAHPQLLGALALLFGAMLLLTDLVTSVLAFWLDPRQHSPTSSSTASR